MTQPISNEQAMKIAIGGAVSPKMSMKKREKLVDFLHDMSYAHINGLSAVAKATNPADEIHQMAKGALMALSDACLKKISEIERKEPAPGENDFDPESRD